MHCYSNRLNWTAPANSFSTLLAERIAAGHTLLDLTLTNPTEALLDYPHARIADALHAVSNFGYQPEPFGLRATRELIAQRVQRRMPSSQVSPAQIALTASTSEAYSLLFKLLCDPGDEVLVPTPSYPLFDYLAQLESIQLKPYRLTYDGSWFLDFESLERAVSARTRALILVNPNNPTGSFLKAVEMQQLQHFATSHQLAVISDEVFMDYAFAGPQHLGSTLVSQHDVLGFALDGLSKSAGMPQMKLGWIVVSGPMFERERACARLELVLDTYLSVSAPVQLAAGGLLSIGDDIQSLLRNRIHHNLATLSCLTANCRVNMLYCEGGWSAILRVPATLSEEEWITRLLRDYSVIVQPGYFFDMPGDAYLVVSLLTAEDTFAEGIHRIVALAEHATQS